MALSYFLISPFLILLRLEDTWAFWKVTGRGNDGLFLRSPKDFP